MREEKKKKWRGREGGRGEVGLHSIFIDSKNLMHFSESFQFWSSSGLVFFNSHSNCTVFLSIAWSLYALKLTLLFITFALYFWL